MDTVKISKLKKEGKAIMKVLVTGGAGFIGSNVVKQLLQRDYEVVVLDNFSTGYEDNLKPFPQVRIYRADIRDRDVVDKATEGVSIIFHLAASVGNVRSLENPLFDSDVNVLGTLNILEVARKKGIKKFVYSSSAALYGEPQYLPIDEKHALHPDSPYGVSKLAGEKHCMCFSSLYDMDIVGLRYFNVYGVNQRYDAYGNVIPIFMTLLLQNQPLTIFGDGEQTRDFVNVEDVVRANLLAAGTEGVRGVFNIGSGMNLTVNRLAALIQDIFKISVKIKYSPPRKGEVKHSLSDISRAKSMLRYTPQVSIEEGLEKYFDWINNM